MTVVQSFALIVVGDEILTGRRQDRHFAYFRECLRERGFGLSWHWVLPDDPGVLTEHLRLSMSWELPVFVCGGIGATPDDHTRACAASAAGVHLVRHPRAADEIERRFGGAAYPHRIRMADLPEGCSLIPNPHNRIPGFGIGSHWFLPGFPEMAWPMARWVLDQHFRKPGQVLAESSLRAFGVGEGAMVSLMQDLVRRHPDLKLFSLPQLGDPPSIEIGFRGSREGVSTAMDDLKRELDATDVTYRDDND